MQNVLNKITQRKAQDLQIMKGELPLLEIISACKKTTRKFYDAFKSERTHFILECKKASPSKGIIRPNFRPGDIAQVYNSYASAISVLTDVPFFHGHYSYLEEVRSRSHLPLLCKDFFIDEYQVYRARYHGADAILLILGILSDEQYLDLRNLAESLGMGVLTEISNQEEAIRARQLKAVLVGINNRDLRDFSIDVNRTALLGSYLAPEQMVISESGIDNHSQIKMIAKSCRGFLIGSSLMAQNDLDYACRKLIYGHNKVCGVKDKETMRAAFDAGACYIGFNFVKSSVRYLDLQTAQQLAAHSPLPIVGVFQDHLLQEVLETVKLSSLQIVQLHGAESVDYILALRSMLPEQVKIWKAINIESRQQSLYWEMPAIEYILLDSQINSSFGGTGKSFDWNLLQGLPKDRIILAGGIGPQNAHSASLQGCQGLDLNSKLESSPGMKSLTLLNQTFDEIKKY